MAAPAEDKSYPRYAKMVAFLARVPAIKSHTINAGLSDGRWWVDFTIDIRHHLAWRTVQELGFVLNYLSLGERLPTVFKPISAPPYMNGGPDEYLHWLIECDLAAMAPGTVADWLEGRLPRPVDDLEQWRISGED